MSITVKQEAKSFFKGIFSKIKLVYILFLHILVLVYTPYITLTHQSDQDGNVFTYSIKIPFTDIEYKDTFVRLKE